MANTYLRLVVLSLALFLMQIPHIRAAVITVNTEEDVINSFDLKCSLREAVITANANPPGVIIAPPGECAPGSGEDEIVFDPSLDQVPILLTIAGAGDNTALAGDLDISDNLTVTGRGQVNTVIDGNFSDRVFDIIGPGTSVVMTGLTITGGVLTDTAGAGILNGGMLTLNTVFIHSNFITGAADSSVGGGVSNIGTLNLTDTTIDRNEADRGGGIYSESSLTVSGSTVSNNTARAGGGLTNFGNADITNSTFSGNEAAGNGGAIDNSSAGAFIGTADIASSTIVDNTAPDSAGGGIVNTSTLTIRNTIVANNAGDDCGSFVPVTSDGNNLNSDGTCMLSELTDVSNTDPMIDTPSFNGGITVTHALLPGSPAIDAGNDLTCPAADQRGVVRPQDGLDDGIPACDIGALEMLLSELAPQTTGGGGGAAAACALAQAGNNGSAFPLYLLIPAVIIWRRLRKPGSGSRRTHYR